MKCRVDWSILLYDISSSINREHKQAFLLFKHIKRIEKKLNHLQFSPDGFANEKNFPFVCVSWTEYKEANNKFHKEESLDMIK